MRVSLSIGQPRQGAREGVFKALVRISFGSGVSCFSLEEAQKRTVAFLVNSALNGTLFEVLVGKMWFSTTRQSLGNRISAASVWLLTYVMDYFE